MNELALFAGAGGGILGGKLLGWTTVCAVEWEAYPASVLIARQNEGVLPPFPIWDDVCTFDGRPWRGRVDVVSGGFPCQDISSAGKGAGIDGERSGMWAHMARIVREVGPRYVFVENSPMLTSRGLGRVLGDLAAMGYDARWGVLGAHQAGAPHKRDRIWIVAYRLGQDEGDASRSDSNSKRPHRAAMHDGDESGKVESRNEQERQSGSVCEDVADAEKQFARGLPIGTSSEYPRLGVSGEDVADANSFNEWAVQNWINQLKGDSQREFFGDCGCMENSNSERQQEQRNCESAEKTISEPKRAGWWATEPDVGRVAHGVAARVDRLKAIGNGQVPAVAALAWRILSK